MSKISLARNIQNQSRTQIGVTRLWEAFEKLASIPRSSGEEERAIEHIIDFAEEHKIPSFVDSWGNVLLEIRGTPGFEKKPGVVLQGHLDMVCLGMPDPGRFGVKPRIVINKEWVAGTDTTLGADNGIGVSTMLAIAQEAIDHGPLALLFTVSEETNMSGAIHLGFSDQLKRYRYLLNLDSEDEGIATFSSAGGLETQMKVPIEMEHSSETLDLKVTIKGLLGGHSGADIHKGRTTSIQVLSMFLLRILEQIDSAKIVALRAGLRKNVLASEAEVIITLEPRELDQLPQLISETKESALATSQIPEEQQLSIMYEPIEQTTKRVFSRTSSMNITKLLHSLPHGIKRWSPDVPGLVETSTNLAIVETKESYLEIHFLSRSSITEDLPKIHEEIKQHAITHGGSATVSNPYPGWTADPQNPLIPIVKTAWKEVTKGNLSIEAIHAGLECGVIVSKFPNLSALSIGPTIHGAHTTEEKVEISSVSRFYRFVTKILSLIADTA